jgi:hypothetical protein
MTQILPSPCGSCIHRVGITKCRAFPQGIPEDIRVWGDAHNQPRPGQRNTVVWGFKRGTEEKFQDWKEVQEQKI